LKVNIRKVILVIAVLAAAGTAVPVSASVDLEWRPGSQIVHVGDTVRLGLYAVSDSGAPWAMAAMDVIVFHTPDYLRFLGISSQGAPYDWLTDGFFSSAPENLNKNLYDGQMMYTAWSQLGMPAHATPAGLLVTTFEFSAQAAVGRTYVTIPLTYGSSARTRVLDGTVPNLDVTGQLGSARLMIVPIGCLTSVAQAKAVPDETSVQLAGPVVTRSFGSYFYLEDADRTAGIRVNRASGPEPAEGTTPSVVGIIRSLDGERVIDEAVVTAGDPDAVPKPIGMNGRAPHTGLNPQGLLVTLWGAAVVPDPGATVFTLDDGSGQPLRVELHGVAAPGDGDYVVATGALGADSAGPAGPVLRVGHTYDIRTMPE
jgi:hypothetical protein